jgi:Domain of unknown function (DUF4136)
MPQESTSMSFSRSQITAEKAWIDLRIDSTPTPRLLAVLLLSLFVLVTPLVAKKFDVTYDKSTDFSKFKTYVWIPGTPVYDPRIDKYIKDSVNQVLQKSGLSAADFIHADLVVTYHAASGSNVSIGTALDPTFAASGGVPVPGQDMWQTSNVGGVSTLVRKGNITFEILDRSANRAIWSGTAKGTIAESSGLRFEQLSDALGRLFAQFPPGKR